MDLVIGPKVLALAVCLIVAALQIFAWIYGFDGQISQLVGVVFGAIITYFFKNGSQKATDH